MGAVGLPGMFQLLCMCIGMLYIDMHVDGGTQPRGPRVRWFQQDFFEAGEAPGSVRRGNALPPCGAARRAYDDQSIHAQTRTIR